MGHSHAKGKSRIYFLHGIFDRITPAQAETVEILADIDQMSQLMNSLLEVRSGQVISFEKAFADV